MLQFLLALLLPFLAVAADVPVPVLKTRVTDLTGTLTAEQQAGIEAKLASFEKRKGSQVAVLILPTTQPETIEQFSLRVVEQWKLGRKRVDDGVLLIVAKNDRRLRIEVGYGLEGALPDATVKRIVSEAIVPRFSRADFYGGISAGTDDILRAIEGEPLPPPTKAQAWPAPEAASRDSFEAAVVIGAAFLVLLVIIAIVYFDPNVAPARSRIGGTAYEIRSWRPRLRPQQLDIAQRGAVALIASSVCGVGAWLLTGEVLFGVAIAIMVFLIPWFVRSRDGETGTWAPAGSTSGSSGGGFLGGGGLFGGGGASGDWGGGDGGGE